MYFEKKKKYFCPDPAVRFAGGLVPDPGLFSWIGSGSGLFSCVGPRSGQPQPGYATLRSVITTFRFFCSQLV